MRQSAFLLRRVGATNCGRILAINLNYKSISAWTSAIDNPRDSAICSAVNPKLANRGMADRLADRSVSV